MSLYFAWLQAFYNSLYALGYTLKMLLIAAKFWNIKQFQQTNSVPVLEQFFADNNNL